MTQGTSILTFQLDLCKRNKAYALTFHVKKKDLTVNFMMSGFDGKCHAHSSILI